MRYLIVICVILSTVFCKGAENQIEERIKIQQSRLSDINQIVFQQREDVGNWYSFWVEQIRLSALQYAGKLKFSERAVWTEFIRITNQSPLTDAYFFNAPTFLDDRKVYELRTAMMDSFFLDSAADFLMDAGTPALLSYLANSYVYLTDNKEENFLLRREAQKILTAAEFFNLQLSRIENIREIKLAQAEQWEMDTRADLADVTRQIEKQPQTQYGVVTAISYGPKDVSCLIEGIDDIIKQGDIIHNNIKVVQIDRYKIEFANNGQRWIQDIGQAAKPMWKNP